MICAFFGFGLAFRLFEYLSGATASPQKLLLSALWFTLPVVGTWMNSARYVGLTALGGDLLFFDTNDKSSPAEFLEAIRKTRDEEFRESAAEPLARAIGFTAR